MPVSDAVIIIDAGRRTVPVAGGFRGAAWVRGAKLDVVPRAAMAGYVGLSAFLLAGSLLGQTLLVTLLLGCLLLGCLLLVLPL